MKFLLISIFTILPFLKENDFSWKETISLHGDFKVECPGSMKEVSTKAETAIGTLEYHTYVFRDENPEADNLMYTITYCDYPEGSLHSDDKELAQEFLAATVEESASSIDAELLYQTDVEVGDYPAKLWRVDYNNGEGAIRTKAFVKENRFYSIQTVCSREKSLNKSSDKFMNSFRFLTEKEKLHLSQNEELNGTTIPLPPNRDNHTNGEKDTKDKRSRSKK